MYTENLSLMAISRSRPTLNQEEGAGVPSTVKHPLGSELKRAVRERLVLPRFQAYPREMRRMRVRSPLLLKGCLQERPISRAIEL